MGFVDEAIVSALDTSSNAARGSFFPSVTAQVLTAMAFLAAVSISAHWLLARFAILRLWQLDGWRTATASQIIVFFVLVNSWLFVFASAFLIFAIGLELSDTSCSVAIYLCTTLYASTKAFLYAFLTAKVHTVWASEESSRWQSPMYLLSLVSVMLYPGVVALALAVGRYSTIAADDICYIGLSKASSATWMIYDLYLNVLMIVLFAMPLVRSGGSARVRRVAKGTLIIALVSLTLASVNMLTLFIKSGQELGWVFLSTCSADTFLSALALFWITGGGVSATGCTCTPGTSRGGGGGGATSRKGGDTGAISAHSHAPTTPITFQFQSRPSATVAAARSSKALEPVAEHHHQSGWRMSAPNPPKKVPVLLGGNVKQGTDDKPTGVFAGSRVEAPSDRSSCSDVELESGKEGARAQLDYDAL